LGIIGLTMEGVWVTAGIELAFKDNIDWILHVDTDELMYPGGSPEYSLQRVLAVFAPDVDTVVFPNYESLPERDDVQDPFTEVGPEAFISSIREQDQPTSSSPLLSSARFLLFQY
jgi:hypothetical protein